MKYIKYFITLAFLLLSFNSFGFSANDKPVQVVIPFGPGGGTDIIFRKLQKYCEKLNLTLTPVYKPGANGAIGMQTLYESQPDGYTLGIITFDTLAAHSLKNKIDLSGVISIQKNTFGIVTHRNENLQEIFSKASESTPVKAGYLLLSQKIILENLIELYGVKKHAILVPYKTGSEMTQNIISKDIDLGITSLNALAPLIRSNKIKLIAVDSASPVNEFPNTLVLNSLAKNFSSINKGASLVLPPNTSTEVIKFWQSFVRSYLNDSEVKQDARTNFWEPVTKSVKDLEKDLAETMILLQ